MSLSTTTCVLLPGLDGTGELFDPFVRAARGVLSCQVVRYPADQVRSPAQLVDQIQREVARLERFVVVAESYSGPIALRLAARDPASLVGLVLCNSFIYAPVWRGLGLLPLKLLFRLPPSELVIRRLLVGADAPAELVSAVRHAVARVSPAVVAARVRDILTADERAALANCPVPVLHLRGTEDRLVSDDALQRMRAARPGLQSVALPGPHLLLQRRPGECVDAIQRFILEVAEARTE